MTLFQSLTVFTSTSLLFLLLAIGVLSTHADDVENIISWVRSMGGSFSSKLEIRRVNPSDETSYFGVFAKDPIPQKEILMNIPTSCYISIQDDAEYTYVKDWQEPYYNNICKLIHKLDLEMRLGEGSDYAPYIAYLQKQKTGQTPAVWSDEGKEMLRKLAVPGSDIVDWIQLRFKDNKCIDGDDPHQEHLAAMTVQRCFDTALIPIWDMVNHHNGKINTENDSMHAENGLEVRAARDIDAGEEIYASYDKCLDCANVEDMWGTPEILKDFGFLEDYPHRYVFFDEGIWFEVNQEGEDLKVTFDTEDEHEDDDEEWGIAWGVPQEDQIQFLEKELERVTKASEIFNQHYSMPPREMDIIYNYYMAYVVDIHAALDAARKAIRTDEL